MGGDPQMFITKVENLQVAQRLKHLPAMRETLVRSLGQENPLEKKMSTHSSILAWESHRPRRLEGYSPCGLKESNMTL